MNPTTPTGPLTKATILAARQCARRPWLAAHAPELAAPIDSRRQAVIDTAAAITRYARALFPGGIDVEEENLDAALARTRALIADASVPAIFAAAFVHDGIPVRVDTLERLAGGGWGIRVVKSTARVKERHLDDAAVQRWVAVAAGLDVRSVEVIHVDGEYVRDDGIDWRRFFRRVEIAEEVAERTADLPALVGGVRQTLVSSAMPMVEPSAHCGQRTRRCDFWAYCTREKTSDWIYHLPKVAPEVRDALRAAGIQRIVDVPDDVELSAVAARVREVVRSGRAFVSAELGAALAAFGPPAYYLDFETMNATVPLYPGTRPFEQVPFQWSLHHVAADGAVSHREFLATGDGDPRRAVAETLIAAVGASADPIIAYSSFESQVLQGLAEALPDLAPALEAIDARLQDLCELVFTHVYHPAFQYSFSLKRVAPALVPGFGYADLDGISEGADAAMAFTRVANGEADTAEIAATRAALLAYCRRDTEALVQLHRALHQLSADSDASTDRAAYP